MIRSFFSKKFALCVIFAFFSFTSVAKVSEQKVEEAAKEFEKSFGQAREKLKIPGCAAVIVRHDKVVKIICKGTTEMNGKEEITPQTIFPLSSLTKNITAYVVGALVDEGKISFDDKVQKYLPEFFIGNEEISKKFTIRDLISHRSGFHHFLANSLWHAGYSYEQMFKSLHFVNKVSGFRRKYGYQNIIFGIVGAVIERATGQSFEELVDKYIFSKIQAENASVRPLYVEESWYEQVKDNFKKHGVWYTLKNLFNIKTHKVVTNHSIYEGKEYPLIKNDYFQRVPATAAISMSPEDFGQWFLVLMNQGRFNRKQIVSSETYQELTKNHVDIKGLKNTNQMFPTERLKNVYYGMGVFGADYGDLQKNQPPKHIFFHMGGVYGACTFFAYCPEEDIGIGVLANLGGTDKTLFSEYMCWDFLDKVFGYSHIDWVQKEIDTNQKNDKNQDKYMRTMRDENPGPHAKLSKYVGTYTSSTYGDVKISLKNKQLIIDNGIRQARLTHINRNIFGLDGREFCVDTFDRPEFVIFYEDEDSNFNEMLVSCLDENDTIFERK